MVGAFEAPGKATVIAMVGKSEKLHDDSGPPGRGIWVDLTYEC